MSAFESVIGLEVHVQLATRSKIFSGASTAYGAPPNTQASLIDLGFPGVLPVLNAEAIRMAVKLGLAIDAEIASVCVFDRKNYFYPDLPKGYQITQLDHPVVGTGAIEVNLVDGGTRRVGITRAHLEEDAGKSLHEDFAGMTGIDLNRAGMPLLEIVTEPDLRTAAEAAACFRAFHALVRYLGISDGNLNEGSMRCDANVSVRPLGEAALGERTEIKNLNSFRFLERAIDHEIERHVALIESGRRVTRETRLYDPGRDETRAMRSKEFSDDYRYFPEPDLLPVVIEPALVDAVRDELPELPGGKRRRYQHALGLTAYDAGWLTDDPDVARCFEDIVAHGGEPKRAAHWVMGEVSAALNRHELGMREMPVPAAQMGKLIARIEDGTISSKIAKTVFEALWEAPESDVDEIVEARGLEQVSDTDALAALVDETVDANPEQVAQYRAGKTKVLGFFVGRIMKASEGKADPKQVNELLRKALDG